MKSNTVESQNKHKKALTTLISSPKFLSSIKTIHSPSLSQLTTTTFSPNVSNLENFISNFQNLHSGFRRTILGKKTEKSKFLSPLKLKPSNEDRKTEYKNWIVSNQLETSTILVPENLETIKSPNGFLPFFHEKEEIKIPFELTNSMTTRNFLGRHLSFNETQIKKIQDSVAGLQLEKYSQLFLDIKKTNNMTLDSVKKTRKVKKLKYANSFQRNSEINFIGVGEEEEEADDTPQNLTYKMFVNLKENQDFANKPGIREAASINMIDSKAFLFGGLSNKLINTVHMLETNTWKWTKMSFHSDTEFPGRYGHISLSYKNGFVIYGGERQYNSSLRIRECLNDVRYFGVDTGEWKFIKTWGDFVEGRRSHAGVILTKCMVVYGGINNNGKFLNDVVQFNLEHHKWTVCEIEPSTLNDEALAFHSMCAVFKAEPKVANIYNPYEYQQILKKGNNGQTPQRNIMEEGIYVFGGKNRNNEPSNRLKILKIGKKPLVWIQPKTVGQPPAPRFQHTMTYQEEFNFLIIYGGRNDILGIFGDLFLLRLSNLNWYNVAVHGEFVGQQRFGHCAAGVADKFLIFGGVDNNGFSKAELLVFELSPKVVKRLINEEQIKKRKTMLMNQNQNSEEIKDTVKNESLEKDNQKDEQQILMDSLNFKKFRTYMPLPIDESVKKKSMNFWKKTLGGVKFLVKMQQSKLKSEKAENLI